MRSLNAILSITAALAIGVLPSLAATAPRVPAGTPAAASAKGKESKTQTKSLQGTVVSMTGDMLIVRSGKKDTIFKLDGSTQKPAVVDSGRDVTVSYHNDGNKHIASLIALSATDRK